MSKLKRLPTVALILLVLAVAACGRPDTDNIDLPFLPKPTTSESTSPPEEDQTKPEESPSTTNSPSPIVRCSSLNYHDVVVAYMMVCFEIHDEKVLTMIIHGKTSPEKLKQHEGIKLEVWFEQEGQEEEGDSKTTCDLKVTYKVCTTESPSKLPPGSYTLAMRATANDFTSPVIREGIIIIR